MVLSANRGIKTQTRRIAQFRTCANKLQPMLADRWLPGDIANWQHWVGTRYAKWAVGDHIWVRETWSADFANHYPYEPVWYRADDDRASSIERLHTGERGIYSPESKTFVEFRWHPSIHMPRWASRITLEIIALSFEPLQSITRNDAIAEGIESVGGGRYWRNYTGTVPFACPIDSYRSLWTSIHGADSWTSNPWVHVIGFKKV